MKKLLILALLFAINHTCVFAQTQKEINKDNRARDRYSEKVISSKSPKNVRKYAKQYEREGWLVAPGHLPLVKQLEISWNMQAQRDESGYPLYFSGDATSIGENYDAAKMQALELAKMNVATMIETELTTIIENSVDNRQLASEQAASVIQTIKSSRGEITHRLGRTIPVVELYRTLRNKNKEVRVIIFYNVKMAMESAKVIIREKMEEKNMEHQIRLDEIYGVK